MTRGKPFVVLLLGLLTIALSLPQQPKSKRPVPVFKVLRDVNIFTLFSASEFFTRDYRAHELFMIIEFPNQIFQQPKTGGLLLPDNATLIRENIVDTFSCQDRIYGYYADMANECQVFHVCMPQTRSSIRWSFICPAETVFNQVN